MACFSAHVLAGLYQLGVPAGLVRGLIPVKDFAAVSLVLVLLFRELRSKEPTRWMIIPAALLVFVVVLGFLADDGSGTSSDAALSLRNAAVPFVAALTGLLLRDRERRWLVPRAVLLIAAAAVYSLVEYLLPVSFVRDVIGVGQYWTDVKEQGFHLSPKRTGLPGNFFTSGDMRRLSGSFGDPLAAGYTLAMGTVLAFLSERRRETWPCLVVLGIALLLTFTRGGWLLVIASLAPLAVIRLSRLGWRERLGFGLAAVAAVVVLLSLPPFRRYVGDIARGRDDSTRGHLNALFHSTGYDYTFFGSGWGQSGGAVGRGTESVFVTLSLQVGVVGLVCYLVALVWVLMRLRRRWASQGLLLPYLGLLLGLLVSMAISEQLLTFNTGWVLLFALGLATWRDEPWTPAPQRQKRHPVAVATRHTAAEPG
jgi:hypothetical protein